MLTIAMRKIRHDRIGNLKSSNIDVQHEYVLKEGVN